MKIPKDLETAFRISSGHVNKHRSDRILVLTSSSGQWHVEIADPNEYKKSNLTISHLISGKTKEIEYFLLGIYKIIHYLF